MSLSPMSHVEFKKCPCRPVDFRGQGPFYSLNNEHFFSARMPGLTAFSMVGKLVAAAGFASVHVFSAETFPTTVRNSGVGLGSMWSGLGGLLARQTNNVSGPTFVTICLYIKIKCGFVEH